MCQSSVRQIVRAALLAGACTLAAIPVGAQTPADNTKVNERDRAKGAPTADQQKENATDRDIARKIRKALMQDKALSTYAHNVKVIAQGGQVTLKGPVRSDEEKRDVEAKAAEIAGAGHVTNDLSVAPAKSKRAKG
jgi:hyperosmotically inducible periplasmic protein